MDLNERKLIFLHIPKTAGSTFHTILNARYPVKNTFNIFGSRYSDSEIKHFVHMPFEEKNNVSLLKGHMPFGLHQYMPGESRYITILRDPVERVISQYFYIKKNTHNPLHEKVEKGGMTLEDFVTSRVSIGMNNGQCRFLNGDLDEYPFGECNENLLENVKQNIAKHFIWVGITERFDESLLLLAREIGWKKQPNYMRANVSKIRKKAEQIEDSTIEVIKEFNKLDILLYEHVNKSLDAAIGADPLFIEKLKQFRDKNAILESRWGWLPDSVRAMVLSM